MMKMSIGGAISRQLIRGILIEASNLQNKTIRFLQNMLTWDHVVGSELLDVDPNETTSQTKSAARTKRALTSAHTSDKASMATTRQSWVDVVKSKSSGGSNAPLRPILKGSPILSL
jgi:hypothetical protein